jgi:cytochrome c oxidase cbb3-type subunit 3
MRFSDFRFFRMALAALTLAFFTIAGFHSPESRASEEGQQLFLENCGVCHGNSGNGGVGVPLALPDFINNVDDQYLKNTIRHGRPGRIMPSFNNLSDRQVNAIVGYMRSWTGKKAPVYSQQTVAGDITKGRAIYEQRCAACHGKNGEGSHGTGVTFSRPRDLPVLAPALNNAGFLASASDAMIRKTLISGRKGTPMTSFLEQGLNEKDIDNVVAFVRSFEKQTSETISKAAAEPPYLVRESPHSLERTIQSVKDSVLSANMRLIRVQHLDQGLVEPEKENPKQVIVYSCGFNFLNEALKVDPRVGLFLPCRVSIVEHKGKVLVMTVNPKRLSAVFNNNELELLCEQMHQTYIDILEEATL